MDDLDLCPNTIVGSQVNNGGCAASQLDSDSDGIVDSFDQCQNTPIGSVVDQTGCIVGTSNTGNNTGSGTGNNTGSGSSSGDSSSDGMPGFEAVYLLISIMVAIIFFNNEGKIVQWLLRALTCRLWNTNDDIRPVPLDVWSHVRFAAHCDNEQPYESE